MSILTTLVVADAGNATIAGADLATEPARVRERIGLSGQYAAVDEVLTGRENLVMVGRLYRLGKKAATDRANELLERFALTESADRQVKGYSGGMRRRLDLAGALVAAPPILFLDEPTTGLDPRSRTDLWQEIRELVNAGTTVLLTTQYLEEADQLADEIVVIDHGRIIAQGTSDTLKANVGGARVEVIVADAASVDATRDILAKHAAGAAPADVEVNAATRTLLAPIADIALLSDVMTELRAAGISVTDIGVRRPTLDDVFLTLTGHHTSATTESDVDDHSKAPAR